MFYLALDDLAVAGASPELLVRVDDGEVAIHPIAGTRRRDPIRREDAALEAELRADEKERAEHVMLVDLGRNDVGRVSAPGSVRVTQFLDVERYSHVMHLVSHVTGRLREGLTPYDALRAGFPAGTVSGAPKVRAMRILAELEGQRRGSTRAPSAISASTAISNLHRHSHAASSRAASPMPRRAAASSPIRFQRRSLTRRRTSWARRCGRWTRRKRHGRDAAADR